MSVTHRVRAHHDESYEEFLVARLADVALARNGFIQVPVRGHGASRDYAAVVRGMQRMTDDCTLHADVPWRTFEVDAYGERYAQEVGLSQPQPHKPDRKFRFQYTPEMMRDVPERALRISEVAAMFRALESIDVRAREIGVAVAACLDAANGRRPRADRYAGSLAELVESGRCVTRVLRYQHRDDAAPDAKTHIDRSILTVHNWASHEGLRVFSPTGEISSVSETAVDSVAVFGGEKLAALTRGRLGFGTPHGVYDSRRTSGNPAEDRYAIVSFVHPITRTSDAQWLLTHREEIEVYESRFSIPIH